MNNNFNEWEAVFFFFFIMPGVLVIVAKSCKELKDEVRPSNLTLAFWASEIKSDRATDYTLYLYTWE